MILYYIGRLLIAVDVIQVEVSLVMSSRHVDAVWLSLGNTSGSGGQEHQTVDHVVGVQEFALNNFKHLYNNYYLTEVIV